MGRNEIIDFLEKEETYNRVLEIIENVCQTDDTHLDAYPQDCFIAGGAVANTIHYLLHKEEFDKPVINDVDLFLFNQVTQHQRVEYGLNEPNFLHFNVNNNNINFDGYNSYWVGPSGEEFRMTNSERFSTINKITINVKLWERKFTVTDYYRHLLENFDLNCTMVGLDRVNNKIIYNDEFVFFLETNKIEITNVKNPIQTAIRMYKKSVELKTDTTKFETEMSLLQHTFFLHKVESIGPTWHAKFKEYSEFMDYYFIEKTDDNFIIDNSNLYNYTSKPFKLNPLVQQLYFATINDLVTHWNLFVRVKEKETSEKLKTFYFNIKNLEKEFKNVIYDPYDNESPFIPRKGMGYSFHNVCAFLPKYLNCTYSVEDLVVVDNFISFLISSGLHPRIFLVSNIKEQKDFIKFFNKKFVTKFGTIKKSLIDKIIGISSYDIKNKSTLLSADKNTKEEAINFLLNNLWTEKRGNIFKHRLIKKDINQSPINDEIEW